METEQLKVIAEGMGLSPRFKKLNSGFELEAKVGSYGWINYSPLKNNDQMVEIMEKLKISICPNSAKEWTARAQFEHLGALGKTINEAVCKAAYEVFKK